MAAKKKPSELVIELRDAIAKQDQKLVLLKEMIQIFLDARGPRELEAAQDMARELDLD